MVNLIGLLAGLNEAGGLCGPCQFGTRWDSRSREELLWYLQLFCSPGNWGWFERIAAKAAPTVECLVGAALAANISKFVNTHCSLLLNFSVLDDG